MPTDKAVLLTHPIRARILTALLDRRLTTGQIAALLPDVPVPSLYRHIRLLTDAEVLEVTEELRVNGAPARVYRVRPRGANIRQEDIKDATQAEHLSYLSTFLNTLAETYRTYLAVNGNTPHPQTIHALMKSLALSEEDYKSFMEELGSVIQRWSQLPADPARKRVILAHIILPDLPDPEIQ